MEPLFRELSAADLPELSRVFREAFSADLSVREWSWKYFDAPLPGASFVAVVDGRPEGFFGAWGTRYRGADGNLPGVAAVDVMTSRSARALGRQGAFRALASTFFARNGARGSPFVFGFPNDRHRKTGEKLLEYVEVERCGEWERPPGRLPRGPRLFRRAVREARFGDAHEPLAEALHGRAGWRSDRSARLLDWRFASRPGVDYRAVQLLDLRGRSRGYAVLRRDGGLLRFVDLQVRDEGSGDLPDLLGAVADDPSLDGAAWRIRAPRRGLLAARLVDELGFAPCESDCSFTVRRLRDDFDVAEAAGSFDYRFADHDIF